MNARYYNSNTGRFLSQDSYKGSAYSPWTQNLYTYCGNNPINYIDPTGHSSVITQEEDWVYHGNTRTEKRPEKMVEVASTQVGIKEGPGDNETKYTQWYEDKLAGYTWLDGEPWCMIFVSWSANEAGIMTTEKQASAPFIPKCFRVSKAIDWYEANDRYLSADSNYLPKAGDVIFLEGPGGQHVGIVASYDFANNMVYTIEGNNGNKVGVFSYSRDNQNNDSLQIVGVGYNGGTSYGTIPQTSISTSGGIR